MSARGHSGQLEQLEKSLEQALAIVRNTPHEGLTAVKWLETAGALGQSLSEARDASSSIRQSMRLGGARSALLLYLRSNVGRPIKPYALEGVSGIREWARRIRELRAVGWDIVCIGSGPTATYQLNDAQLEEDVARDDKIIDSIGGKQPKERIIEYLVHLSPWPASSKQLERVAGVAWWRQEISELIDDGWLIRSHEDDPELEPGSFRLSRLED